MPRKPKQAYIIGRVQIRLRGDTWHARFSTPAGRKGTSLKTGSLEVAMQKAKEIDNQLQGGNWAALLESGPAKKMLFRDLVREFRENYQGWSAGTRKGQNGFVVNLEAHFGDLPLDTITSASVQRFLALRTNLGNSAGTVNQ